MHPAGVGRQYSGTLGRADNCHAVFLLGCASEHGHTLVDRRLYLHAGWLADPAKRASRRAAVPADVGFLTKLELAATTLVAATARGHLPYARVTADAADGDSHDLRRLVAEQGRWYCFEVSRDALVWTTDPAWRTPPRSAPESGPRSSAISATPRGRRPRGGGRGGLPAPDDRGGRRAGQGGGRFDHYAVTSYCPGGH